MYKYTDYYAKYDNCLSQGPIVMCRHPPARRNFMQTIKKIFAENTL